MKADTATEQSKLAPLQAQLDQAQRDAAHAATFKAELQSLQQAMPDSPALAAFIRDANGIADASGVSWQSVTHGPPTPAPTASMSITVGIQVKGTYAQVIDYLGRSSPRCKRLVVVDSVQLTTAGHHRRDDRRRAVDRASRPGRSAARSSSRHDLGPHVRDAERDRRRRRATGASSDRSAPRRHRRRPRPATRRR